MTKPTQQQFHGFMEEQRKRKSSQAAIDTALIKKGWVELIAGPDVYPGNWWIKGKDQWKPAIIEADGNDELFVHLPGTIPAISLATVRFLGLQIKPIREDPDSGFGHGLTS